MGMYPATGKILIIIGIFVLIALITPTTASPLLVSGIENPLPIYIPELLTAPAPSWVTEGLRFSYDTMASLNRADMNPNGVTFQTDSPKTGVGITQLTVVGMSGNSVAVTTDSYAPKPPYDTMYLVHAHGSVYPAGCGPFWVNPDVIAAYADRSTGSFMASRIPYTVGGKTYDAVMFDFPSGEHGVLSMIYDLKTGMLLYHVANIENNVWFQEEGQEYQRQSGTYAMFVLRNTRTVQIPWITGTMPSWVQPGISMTYSGVKEFSVDGQIGPPTQSPLTSMYSFGAGTDRLAPLVVSTVSQDLVTSQSSVNLVTGMAHIGGLFIPPEAARLGTGTFDQDPDTGFVSSITQNDYNGIVVTKTNGFDNSAEYDYDVSGKLVRFVTMMRTSTTSGFGSTEQMTMNLLGY